MSGPLLLLLKRGQEEGIVPHQQPGSAGERGSKMRVIELVAYLRDQDGATAYVHIRGECFGLFNRASGETDLVSKTRTLCAKEEIDVDLLDIEECAPTITQP